MNCFLFVSNLDLSFWTRTVSVMNSYANRKAEESETGHFAGTTWKKNKFTLKTIINALGIILKISLDGRKQGGYTQYFCNSNSIQANFEKRYKISGHQPWAKKIMRLHDFKQVLAALRIENKPTDGVNDKAYQLRKISQLLSVGARCTFKPGRYLSFDEGGIASRSRKNPIRQYNKDKPSKFRVDFFLLSDAQKYFFTILTHTKEGMHLKSM